MADKADLVVAEVLGWKADKETKTVQVGFRAADGKEAVLALPANLVDETIAQLVHARGALESPKDIGREFAMKVSGAQFGSTLGGNDVFLRLSIAGGGQLGFSLDKSLARDLVPELATRASRGRE